ncbi:MAG: sulfite exporter TauE/SafE family protein [Candidatus Altiarchaeales archaeon]|nr:MAG: sulfite exporter TauE/SafE family protein [Candidatus Altiarchaeales archaeon]HDO82708.1 sulfite exporter TauE/SafE family protein [Candidatus Altiarchaeales archaeon]HEX55357.1 sulfite exporter TauE/SafE family protein [Candidatus Altiarchaeales archaeon]
MYFPISGVEVNVVYLIVLGFIVGALGGFFGVGGGFIASPIMYLLGIPMNFVVGTDLTHMVGKSIVAAKKHRSLGHVDIKLGFIMVFSTIIGIEIGAQIIEFLKDTGKIDVVIGLLYVSILTFISIFVAWESKKALRVSRVEKLPVGDVVAFKSVTRKIRRVNIPPYISLPESGIESISIWIILLVGFISGLLSGLLGVGGGFVRMPLLVYLVGCPTHVAIGTDLFEIVISSSYGSLTHAIKGNVDIMIALVMHTGAAIGAQMGAVLTRYISGPRIRLYFSLLPIIGALMVLYKLSSIGAI